MKKMIKGHCLCQKVQYQLHDEPKAVGCCYCKSCQIKSGSDHIVYLAFEKNFVTIDGPVKWYETTGDSGKTKQHGFCSECGSTLFGKPQLWPHIMIVYSGSLLDSSQYEPKINLWVQDAPRWACLNKLLETYDGNPGESARG